VNALGSQLKRGNLRVAYHGETGPPGPKGDKGDSGNVELIQSQNSVYVPTVAQNATTSWVKLNGSDQSFTPLESDSLIIYSYNFIVTRVNSNGIGHFKLQLDSSDQTESGLTVGGINGVEHAVVDFKHGVDSWGTTAKTFQVMMREWGSNEVKAFETVYYDGGSSAVLKQAVLSINEYI